MVLARETGHDGRRCGLGGGRGGRGCGWEGLGALMGRGFLLLWSSEVEVLREGCRMLLAVELRL